MKTISLICLFVLLAGCIFMPPFKSVSSVKDGGFISLKPCGPPCFFGITPGITSTSQFNTIMNSNNSVFSHCKTIDNPYIGKNHHGINCDNGIAMSFTDQRVDGLGFIPTTPIKLGEVIELYGYPDLVDTMVVSLPDKPFESSFTLYYDQIRVILGSEDQAGIEYTVASDTIINDIAYYTQSKYQSFRTFVGTQGTLWKGFGSYSARLLP